MNSHQPKIKYEKWLKCQSLDIFIASKKIQSIYMHILVPPTMVVDISRENCTPGKTKFTFDFSLNSHYSFEHAQLA